jgi:predicted phosphoribosyltransferase
MRRFRDRAHAGRELAAVLGDYAGRPDVLVLGLPRGGVPVAAAVADALDAPLDVYLVRKLGVPGHEELAMGAIASGGVRVLNDDVLDALELQRTDLEDVTAREARELARREKDYRGDRPAPELGGRVVLIVDDGLATGSSMLAAVRSLRQAGARQIVVAVPVAPRPTCDHLRDEADEVICAYTPEPFRAVGIWYEDFDQTTDEEVRQALATRREHWNAGRG